MNTKKIDFWQDTIEKQKESNLSISQWCKENGIKKTRFYYWNNKISNDQDERNTNEEQVFAKVEIPKKQLETSKETFINTNIKLLWNDLEIIISNKDEIPLVAELIKQLQEIC